MTKTYFLGGELFLVNTREATVLLKMFNIVDSSLVFQWVLYGSICTKLLPS